MTTMNSSRSFKLLALVMVGLVAAAMIGGTATAVTVSEKDVQEEAEVGEKITVSYSLNELFKDPPYTQWSLSGETELQNVTWTVVYRDQTGAKIRQNETDGQNVTAGPLNASGEVAEVQVLVTGDVPSVEEYTYPENETFLLARLVQSRGEDGTSATIGEWRAHHYTQKSREAKNKIQEAEEAIQSAEEAGASPSNAQDNLENAITFYEGDSTDGDFDNAITNAEDAIDEAESAESNAESTEQRNTMLMYGGIALVVLLIIGGGIYWYRQQQDDYSRM